MSNKKTVWIIIGVIFFTLAQIVAIFYKDFLLYNDVFQKLHEDGITSYKIITILSPQDCYDVPLRTEIWNLLNTHQKSYYKNLIDISIECWLEPTCQEEDIVFLQEQFQDVRSIQFIHPLAYEAIVKEQGVPEWALQYPVLRKNILRVWCLSGSEDCRVYLDPILWRQYSDRTLLTSVARGYGVGLARFAQHALFTRQQDPSCNKSTPEVGYTDGRFLLAFKNSPNLRYTKKFLLMRLNQYGKDILPFYEMDMRIDCDGDKNHKALWGARLSWLREHDYIPIDTDAALNWVCGDEFIHNMSSRYGIGIFYRPLSHSVDRPEYYDNRCYAYFLKKHNGEMSVAERDILSQYGY